VLALAFGILVVFPLVGGSIGIMDHLTSNMMPADQMIDICSNPRRPILNCSYTMLYIRWRHSRCQRLSGRQYHPGLGPQLYSADTSRSAPPCKSEFVRMFSRGQQRPLTRARPRRGMPKQDGPGNQSHAGVFMVLAGACGADLDPAL
jgi:hypothetical protein